VIRWIAPFIVLLLAACQSNTPTPPPTQPPAAPPPTSVAPPPASPAAVAKPSPGPSPSPITAAARPSAAPKPSAVAAPPVGSSRADVLNSANAAFARSDYSGASGLYERALNTPPTGESDAQRAAIDQFAHFRDMVALLGAGQEDDAKAQLTALQQQNADAPLTRVAAQLWDQYGMVGQLRGACSQLQPQIATQAAPTLAALQGMGVSVDAQTLCSAPAG
jgi:hypothetical protein